MKKCGKNKMKKMIDILADSSLQGENLLVVFGQSLQAIEITHRRLNDTVLQLLQEKKYNVATDYLQTAEELLKIEESIKSFLNRMNSGEMKKDTSSEDIGNITHPKGEIDYAKYQVDKHISYPISEDFKHTSPYAFAFEGSKYLVDSWYEITIKVCEFLYAKDKSLFQNIALSQEVRGRKNVYITYQNSDTSQGLRSKKKLLDTDIVIEQKLSANQHMAVVKYLLDKYKLPESSIQIYLESDRKPLHGGQAIGTYINTDYDYVAEFSFDLEEEESFGK